MARPSLSPAHARQAKAGYKKLLGILKARNIPLIDLARAIKSNRSAVQRWGARGYVGRYAAAAIAQLKIGITFAELRPDLADYPPAAIKELLADHARVQAVQREVSDRRFASAFRGL